MIWKNYHGKNNHKIKKMNSRISEDKISRVISKALSCEILKEDDTAAIFYDLSFLSERINELKKSFPASSLHTVAVKANPLTKILAHIKKLNLGCEAASLPELYLAVRAGFNKKKIVFDSPAKTIEEIKYVLKSGVHVNADSISELELINGLLKKNSTSSTLGIRINPQVGTGNISATSLAGEYSKFGVPLKEFRNELTNAFIKFDWLRGVHLHIGSQGCPLELLLNGVETVYNFAVEVNEKLKTYNKKTISIFDIGGGLPVSYHKNETRFSVDEYSQELKRRFPGLFNGDLKLITEFGRYLFANSCWTLSRVEHVKKYSAVNTVVTHVGADLMLRRTYDPEVWHHEFSLCDKFGNIKIGSDLSRYSIAGPLCFGGDLLANSIELPNIEKGDYIIIHDTGAYTLSMWSRYNSRQIPKVIGYFNDGKKFEIIKQRESLNKIWNFWS